MNRFFVIVFLFHLAMWSFIALNDFGLKVPIARQPIAFVYLSLLPGYILVRLFKLHRLSAIEILLYSVGLSLAFVMLVGGFINLAYPLIGISRPISVIPLLITFTISLAILCGVIFLRERTEITASPDRLLSWDLFSPPFLFLFFLPFLSILGTSLVNHSENNILLMALIIYIAVLAVLVAFNRFVPVRLYPLALVMIAIALLLHRTLISQYLTGDDIHSEYFFQNFVIINSIWDWNLPFLTNSVLSVAILAPAYSLLLDLSTIWIFKIFYPLLYSLVPLALFQAFRKQTDDRIAFLSVFFFMSFHMFFVGITGLARQQIAEIFFALSILLFVDNKIGDSKRTVLIVIFGSGIAVSHYSISYLYLFYISMCAVIIFVNKHLLHLLLYIIINNNRKNIGIIQSIFTKLKYIASLKIANMLTFHFVLLMMVFAISWNMFIGSTRGFMAITGVMQKTYLGLSEFLDPQTMEPDVQVMTGFAQPLSVQGDIFRYLQYIVQLFIVIGVIGLLFKLEKTKFHPIYVIMTLVSTLILFASILLPYFSTALRISRIYQVTLFFLSPFCILGGITVLGWLLKLFPVKAFRSSYSDMHSKFLVTLVLIPYLLFNTAFVFEVTSDVPSSLSLSPHKFSQVITTREDLAAAEWLSVNAEKASVKGDAFMMSIEKYGVLQNNNIKLFTVQNFSEENDAFIFLRKENITKGEMWLIVGALLEHKQRRVSLTEKSPIFEDKNKIYDNGAVVYGP